MTEIKVGLGTCGISAGAELVYNAIKQGIDDNKLDVQLYETGCMGMCYEEVLVEIIENGHRYLYSHVNPDKARQILDSHIVNKKPLEKWIVCEDDQSKDEDFFKKQHRIVLRNCGVIDPASVDDYLSKKGYQAIQKCLDNYTQDEVIDIISQSGLRGRGGGGFPTGLKWKLTRQTEGKKKYIICNADEGDPGAFMDRSVLEGDPHSVLEGMMIAAYAIGADEAYIYCRAEYPLAIQKLKIAIAQCEDRGYLGKNIFNSEFSFKIKIKEGAGAFVCGEETALIASIEGKRGVPKIKPPFPSVKGLWSKPTSINNVETFANVPWIILNGAERYASLGTEKSKGTKVFALAGKIKRSGLVEVPMGITINEIIMEIGGGIKKDKKFKAVQMGGPSGGCIPAEFEDLKIDYDEITKTGAIMGSGGLIVLDETTCMVDLAKYFLNFTQNESCGKCTFCRIGTKRMLEILTRICDGEGKEGDIELLIDLGEKIKSSSLCGLGQTAPNPVLTTIKYYRHEYEAHIRDKKCPAKSCPALISFEIDKDKCTGCTVCAKKCPVNAISGNKKEVHFLDPQICIKCGLCYDACNFDAIIKK